MHEELVKSLRICAEPEEKCTKCAYFQNDQPCGAGRFLMREAADAIENLQQHIAEYQITLDGANDKIAFALGKDYCYDIEYGRQTLIDKLKPPKEEPQKVEQCITCGNYDFLEISDGMERWCKIDGSHVFPDDHCKNYKPKDDN